MYNHTHQASHSYFVNRFLRILNHKKIYNKNGIYFKRLADFYCDKCKNYKDQRLVLYTCM